MGDVWEYWGNIGEILNSWNLGKKFRIQLFWSGENQIIFFSIFARNKRKKMKMKLKNVQKQRKERNSFILFSILFLYNKQIVNNVDKIFFLGFFIKFFFWIVFSSSRISSIRLNYDFLFFNFFKKCFHGGCWKKKVELWGGMQCED